MKVRFAENITYLINSEILSASSILKITNHGSNGLISMWKNGERQPKVKDVLAIALFLNVTMDDLVVNDIEKVLNNNRKPDASYYNKYESLTDSSKELANKMIDTLYENEINNLKNN